MLNNHLMKSRNYSLAASFSFFLLSVLVATANPELPGGNVIDSTAHHLGTATMKNWPEAPKPEGEWLEKKFDAHSNAKEMTLGIKQRNISRRWSIELNGKDLGDLKSNDQPGFFYYRVPAGALKKGQNVLRIVCDKKDDMVVGPILLYEKSFRELFNLQPVTLQVNDADTGKPVPARVTICDTQHNPKEFYYAESPRTAVRPGILYTTGEKTHLELPPGDYVFYATRGMEWSRGRAAVPLAANSSADVSLKIRREVDTTGFVATDTHMHTLTFSGHGDASVEERVLTLAGEGVELAIATDHNHNIDYRPYQKKLSLNKFFTPVVGNEVSTPVGHITAFPLDPKATPPNQNLHDWVQLVDGIRAKGAKVVGLNHPRWSPLPIFVRFGLSRATGDFSPARAFPFDAMELANALVPEKDPLSVFQDWFALMNHGEKITGLASSDSHTVGEAVGQGRSYVPSKTDDPAKIKVNDACEHFLRGDTCISLGIFADVLVDGRYKMGDTNCVKKGSVDVQLRVAAPSWVQPRRALVFLNGKQVAEKEIPEHAADSPTDLKLDFSVAVPKYDAHVVCVVLGDGVSHPSWHTAEKFTLAATNPIFLDNDGDGKYSSPGETARAVLAKSGKEFNQQWQVTLKADDVIAMQMVSLLSENAEPSAKKQLDELVNEAAKTRPAFAEYIAEASPQSKPGPAAAK